MTVSVQKPWNMIGYYVMVGSGMRWISKGIHGGIKYISNYRSMKNHNALERIQVRMCNMQWGGGRIKVCVSLQEENWADN